MADLDPAALEPIRLTDEVVHYIALYGGACRSCADEWGICPRSGLPCEDYEKAIRHVLEAYNYGVKNGYLKGTYKEAEAAALPIPMLLYCPACGAQHIDAPERFSAATGRDAGKVAWNNPPHKSHLCHECRHIWRPADVPTVGVAAIKTAGKADSKFIAPIRHDALLALKASEAATKLAMEKPGWRDDMENAPRDGTPVWLRDVFGVRLAAYGEVAYDEDEEPLMECWMARDIITGDCECVETPTHWQPVIVPAAPSITESEVKPK